MATVPTPYHFTALTVPTAANMNAGIESALVFLLDQPRVSLYRSATLSLTTATWTQVTWDSESWDTDTMHSTGSNTSRLVFTTAGRYWLNVAAWFDANATGSRGVNLTKNGAGSRSASNVVLSDAVLSAASIGETFVGVTVERAFAAGDYIELFVYQNSGGALNLQAGTNKTVLQARRLSA